MVYAIDAVHEVSLQPLKFPSAYTALAVASSYEPAALKPSARCSMRRMRAETPASARTSLDSPRRVSEKMMALAEQLSASIRDHNIPEAFIILSRMSNLWNESLDIMLEEEINMPGSDLWKSGIDLIGNGAFDEVSAYLFALDKDPQAIARCNEGFEKIHSGITQMMAILGDELFPSDRVDTLITQIHQLFRGLYETALNQREDAIQDLRAGFRLLEENRYEEGEIDQLLFIKILEQRVGARVVDWERLSAQTDNPFAQFKAGNYEEALALLNSPRFQDNDDALDYRIASLALLGKTEEALKLAEADSEYLIPIIHFLNGDAQKAVDTAFSDPNNPMGYLLMLFI